MSQHSSIVGGSTAARLIACPGSYQATVALPPSANRSSEYAEEGTHAHAVMQEIMDYRREYPQQYTHAQLCRFAQTLIGKTIYDREYTEAFHDQVIVPALAALHDLEQDYGGNFIVLAVEYRARFPQIYGAFGTIDLVLVSMTAVLHVDWKFGSGVQVLAEKADGAVNEQLLFYITACRNALRAAYGANRRIIGAIIQPRADVVLSLAEISPTDIKVFRKKLEQAVDKAIGPQPPRAKGDHCRFAPCKTACPLWTGPLIDLSAISGAPVKPDSTVNAPTPYGDYLAKAKYLVDLLEEFKKSIDEQLHSYLEAGGYVPGWRLKHKVKQRQWIDEEVVVDMLLRLGFSNRDIWQAPKLATFKQADAAAKRLGVTIPDELRVAPPTDETTIATTDDPAPVVERALAIEQFRASLKKLTAG